MKRRHPTAVIALVASLLLVGAMTAVIAVESEPASVPVAPLCDLAVFGPDCVAERPDEGTLGSSPRRIDHETADRSTRPVRVVIPTLGVAADVVPVGTRGNTLEIPDDIDVIGWYRFGATPAWGAGSTVLVGHRDGVVEGHGAFYDLAALAPGDAVEVVDTVHRVTRFKVVARAVISKTEFADRSPQLFTTTGPARLRLISCGGYYDAEHGGYQSNVVITAIVES